MKVQIRKNVFETNSSSTHSLQISNNNADDMLTTILSLVCQGNPKTLPEDFDSRYIDGSTLILSGFNYERSEDSSDVYMVLSKLMPKIQYLYMYIVSELEYVIDESDLPEDLEALRNIDYEMRETPAELSKLKCIQIFGELAIKALNANGYNLNNVVFNTPVRSVESYSDFGIHEFISVEHIIGDEQTYMKVINDLLDPTKILYDADQANSQYEGVFVYLY